MTEEIKFKPVNIKPEAHEQLKQFCDEHGMTMAAITENPLIIAVLMTFIIAALMTFKFPLVKYITPADICWRLDLH